MNFISYPRIKRAVGFANLQKISCYGQVPDGSTLKCEIHHLGLRASRAGTLPAEVVSGVSTSTLQQIPVSVSYQSWWLIPDPVKAVFHLLPARALTGSACHLQLQQWQLNQGRLCPRGQKHPWEMDVPYKMPPQRRGWAIPMWASYLFLCSREWGCLFPQGWWYRGNKAMCELHERQLLISKASPASWDQRLCKTPHSSSPMLCKWEGIFANLIFPFYQGNCDFKRKLGSLKSVC